MAKVGIGTLYRHFPMRDTRIETAYRQETDALMDAGTQLIMEQEPLACSCSSYRM
ncbi:hypothetical protein ACE41H_17875 [Paenibacillus enshidis]|uniref:TetR family transcriptional regulator n=1 Tax=Paenibacillus enshidis TaxID=1458439 RepID=A0ABV5AWQ1_9BACL